ncbi:MAG: cell division control protein 14 [Vezdaea aestivalis]|nr:MAG: cell division control protein 14 [Vezdaea aestivalis]
MEAHLKHASHGQVIEYIQDRLYLASYSHAPNTSTPFPYPGVPSRSPNKRSRAHPPPSSGPKVHPPAYFSIDDSLLYNAFHHDFGPLHIGHLYRFAVTLHDILGDPENEGRGVVFWSKPNARARANAACVLACYMVLIQSWPPHLALAPIAQADPPYMPFRDAGYSQADYSISIQDVVYGVWRAKEEGLCGLKDFCLEEYEKYERVDMGDFNWISPSFVAFASPQHTPTAPIPSSSPLYDSLPRTLSEIDAAPIPGPFRNVLSHFVNRDVGLVVRLNSELYSPSYFTALDITHLDMIFDDGTCPPLPLVKRFIKLAHDMITVKKKGIAVHCKAGLGRTGCLIGAYLIYRHGFSANEVIAYMRFMRPGMVVGPQQHWLHLNQGAFREWWFEDSMKEKLALVMPSTPVRATSNHKGRLVSGQNNATPPNGSQQRRAALGEIENESPQSAPLAQDENLPVPTPGQPRKASRVHERYHPYARHTSSSFAIKQEEQSEEAEVSQSRRISDETSGISDEEVQFQLLAKRGASRSPRSSEAKRAVTYTATTTTTSSVTVGADNDVENWEISNGLVKATSRNDKSGSGVIGAIIGTKTRSPRRQDGIRKTSGRVGSLGSVKKNAAAST